MNSKRLLMSGKRGNTLVVSEAIVHEYLDVIHRPKFKIPLQEIIAVTDYLLSAVEFVTPTEAITAVEDDPGDNKFLEVAIAGKVEYVVSGNKHLLQIKEFRSIPILTGREFLERLEEHNL